MAGRSIQMPVETLRSIFFLYATGMSLRGIARETDVDHRLIAYHLRNYKRNPTKYMGILNVNTDNSGIDTNIHD